MDADLLPMVTGDYAPLLVQYPDASVQLVHDRPFFFVGRSSHCDIRVQHPDVSRRHAYFQQIDGHWHVCDLGSRNGIQLSHGSPLCPLVSSADIQIGPVSVRVMPNRIPLAAPDAPPQQHVIDVVFELLDRPSGMRVRLQPGVTICGSDEICKVRMKSTAVSAFHSSIVRGANGVWVVDLLGQYGTKVNGENVATSRRLEDGDELAMGKFRFRVRVEQEMEPIEVSAAVNSMAIVPSALRQPNLQDGSMARLLMAEFSGMQHHLFEQTTQFMAMMAQAVINAQNDQMMMVRGDLERLTEVNLEIKEIQRKLLQSNVAVAEHLQTQSDSPKQVLAGPTAATPDQRTATREPRVESEKPCQTKPKASTPAPRAKAASDSAQSGDHAWLAQRMRELDKERNSRWQRILAAIGGKSDSN